jgi:O-antigen ligase
MISDTGTVPHHPRIQYNRLGTGSTMNAASNATAAREGIPPLAPAAKRGSARSRPFAFWLLMTFFVLEYMRPEPFVQLKLQMASLVLFPVMWLAASRRPWSRNLTIEALFVVVCALTVPFAVNNYSAYMVTRAMYGHAVIALAITWFLANRRDFSFAIWFWVVVMAYQAIYGMTHGGHGSGGSLGDENDLALGLNTALPFAFVGLQQFTGRKRWACAGLLVLFLAGIVASISRGGFVGMVAVVGYCVMMGRNRLRNIAIAVVGAVLFVLAIPESYKGEIASIKDTQSGTAEERRFFWEAARNMWRAHPILGVGAGNSPWNMGRYQPREAGQGAGLFSGAEYAERDYSSTQVHSVFFQTLAELGTAGIVLFFAMVIEHYRTLFALRRRLRRPGVPPALRRDADIYIVALGGGMTGYLAAGAFLSVAYYPYPWYFGAFSVALARAVAQHLSQVPEPVPGPRTVAPQGRGGA